jgi:hypothetical protein
MDLGWPLESHHEQLVRELAGLIARGGGWRFLHAPVIAADVRNYPDKWEENREGVARVLARTLWHAYLDIDVVLDDTRQPAARDRTRLRETHVELTHIDDKRAELTLSSIGNDDVAGLVSHEVGRLFVAKLAKSGSPFRTTAEGLPDLRLGSIAAVYLGLGIIAANSAHHDRSAGETIGRTAYHEHKIFQAGGLDVHDLAFLLAVQATVRDDVLTALETLRPTQAERVAAWREVLDDHEDELNTMLGVEGVDDEAAPSRPSVPRPVVTKGSFAESNLTKFNYGRPVFRFAETRWGTYCFLGLIAGFLVGVVFAVITFELAILMLVLPAVGLVAGILYGRRIRYFRCASCGAFVTETDPECRICGGRIVKEIANPQDRLELEDQLEDEERAAAGLPPKAAADGAQAPTADA